MIVPRDLAPILRKAASSFPALTLTGPRQSGKSTLCRHLFAQHRYVSLEAVDARRFALEDPHAFLAGLGDGAILDEVQRAPELLSYLQGILDADPTPGRWILTGSQNFALMDTISQSLAGRTAVHHLLPLTRNEVLRFASHPQTLDETLLTGGYPRILERQLDPAAWLAPYVATYIERDMRQIANVGDLVTFQRFLQLCAGRTAQLLNYSSLADDCGISQPTAKRWLSLLEMSYIVFRLPPFHTDGSKRLVKMPKLHFHDTGLACWLLGIRTPEQLHSHPLRGALFETWVVSETYKQRLNRGDNPYGLSFYRTRDGTEVDLIVESPSGLTLLEAKAGTTPSANLFDGANRVRRQLQSRFPACETIVVYGGEEKQERSVGTLVPWWACTSRADVTVGEATPLGTSQRQDV